MQAAKDAAAAEAPDSKIKEEDGDVSTEAAYGVDVEEEEDGIHHFFP